MTRKWGHYAQRSDRRFSYQLWLSAPKELSQIGNGRATESEYGYRISAFSPDT